MENSREMFQIKSQKFPSFGFGGTETRQPVETEALSPRALRGCTRDSPAARRGGLALSVCPSSGPACGGPGARCAARSVRTLPEGTLPHKLLLNTVLGTRPSNTEKRARFL